MLRQFAVLSFVVFGSIAGWRAWGGQVDAWTQGLALAAVLVGGVGMAWPAAIRPIFTGWMIAAFPIGWAVSRLALGAMFYVMFTPIALVFKLAGRDALRVRRGPADSYWMPKPAAKSGTDYLRQY
jgi:hypothetical protein